MTAAGPWCAWPVSARVNIYVLTFPVHVLVSFDGPCYLPARRDANCLEKIKHIYNTFACCTWRRRASRSKTTFDIVITNPNLHIGKFRDSKSE